MKHFKSVKVDKLTTPLHRMMCKKRYNDDIYFTLAENFDGNKDFIPKCGDWKGKTYEEIGLVNFSPDETKLITKTKNNNILIEEKDKIPVKSFAKFLGWYLAEGGCYFRQDLDHRRGIPRKEYIISVFQKRKKI